MIQDFDREIDRRLKPDVKKVWTKPTLTKVQLTAKELVGITSAANPKQAFREFCRDNRDRLLPNRD